MGGSVIGAAGGVTDGDAGRGVAAGASTLNSTGTIFSSILSIIAYMSYCQQKNVDKLTYWVQYDNNALNAIRRGAE
jgi:hypothetical protein